MDIKSRLTQREKQILELLCEGKTNSQIARNLQISPKTVESNLTRVYRKLGVNNRAAAVAAYFVEVNQQKLREIPILKFVLREDRLESAEWDQDRKGEGSDE